MGAIALMLMSLPGASPVEGIVVVERVDLIEVNHFYDNRGRLVLDQVIFYDWCEKDCRFHVRAWRLMKQSVQFPYERSARGDFVTIWQDGEALRKISSGSMRETWTQHDPEQAERRHLPQELRRDLASPLKAVLR